MKKKIFVFLFDGFSDWEIAYLSPEIKKSSAFDLIYFSKDGKPVQSMGGLQVLPQMALAEIQADDIEMLILPGGMPWEKGENTEIDPLVKTLFAKGTTIAAICAATTYLGRHGFLNKLKHTSNNLDYLKMMAPGYSGDEYYLNLLAVTGENIITACGIAPVEFAKEVFVKLNLYNEIYTEKWFQLFKNGIWCE